jgi:GT2 family glycosyltransferase
MSYPKVLISVLNWNNWKATETCLEALRRQTYGNAQIVTVDNASQYAPDDFSERFPEAHLLRLRANKGYAGGHLAAVKWATDKNFDLIWLLNNDTVPAPNALAELVKAWRQQPDALYGSVTLKADGTINYGGGSLMKDKQVVDHTYNLHQGKPYEQIKDELHPHEVDQLNGASMLIPFKIIKRYGFIDTRFFLYGEETDYCYRMRKYDIPSIVIPSSVVMHQGAASFAMHPALEYVRIYYRTRNQLWFSKKYDNLTNKTIRRHLAGFRSIFYFFTRHYYDVLRKKCSHHNNKDYRLRYYNMLAIFHALMGVRGKCVSPEKILK